MKKFKQSLFFIIVIICNNLLFSQNFITKWEISFNGPPSATSITIPTFPGNTYNYDVDWNNDGVFDEFGITGNVSHDYGAIGIYTVAIRGTFPRIYFNSEGDNSKIISVDQWGDNPWTSMENAFFGCYNLVLNATDVPDLSLVTNIDNMLNGPTQMIEYEPLNSWDTGTVTSMRGTFENNVDFDQDISNWNTSNVTNMSYMFHNATNFKQDLNNWDVSNVTNMDSMFWFAGFFNSDISGWDVSNVVNMNHMFDNAFLFSQDIGNWDTSSVESMNFMFRSAISFNEDISNWNLSNVSDMTGMFFDASSFNQDINNWNTSSVTSMQNMFNNALAFDQNLGNWDISNVINMTDMFLNTNLSTVNYDNTLIGWNSQPLQNGVTFHAGNSNYCNAETARDNIIALDNWTIIDGGLDCSNLSTNDYNASSFSLYPNPVQDVLFIKDLNKSVTIKIIDITGKIIIQTDSETVQNGIDVSKLKSAIYLVTISTKDSTSTIKIIKK